MNIAESNTIVNLMRAFAGESQARNRYTFAAGMADEQNLHCIKRIFDYTADQEKEHAEQFFNCLRNAGIANVQIEAGYPVDLKMDVAALLRAAQHNEFEEQQIAYPGFARVAREEGFADIGMLFERIATVELTHGNRFATLADLLEAGELFRAPQETDWICLNCGYVHHGTEAPVRCPLCHHDQGYYLRREHAPYAGF